jgi:hypothetical protein
VKTRLLPFVILSALIVGGTEIRAQDDCRIVTEVRASQFDTKARKEFFRQNGMIAYPAKGAFNHQVLGLKIKGSVDKTEWHKQFTKQFDDPQFSLARFQDTILSQSFQGFLWTVKNGYFSHEDKRTAILVKLVFKKEAVFINQNDLSKLTDYATAAKKYAIVGLYDKANDFYKISHFHPLESIEIIDAENQIHLKHQF